MTDRERILTTVIRQLATTQSLRPRAAGQWSSEPYRDDHGSGHYVHFAPWKKAEKGDLVVAKTSGTVHEYLIGFYVEPLTEDLGGAVIREIGSERLCNYSNESFDPIVGLTKEQLLEGERYKVQQKVLKAFQKGREYVYRYGGVDIEAETLTIWVREVFGGYAGDGTRSKPFAVTMPWSKKTTVRAILAAMRAQGYGTFQFERDDSATTLPTT